MRKLLYMLLITGGILFAQTNLAPNPGFENWADENTPENWSYESGITVSRCNVTDSVYSGSYSARVLLTTDNQSNTDFVSDSIDVLPNTEYTFRVHIFDNDPAGRVRLVVHWFDSNMQALQSSYGTYSSDNSDWQVVEYTVTSLADAAFAKLGFRFYDSNSWDGDALFYLDEMSFTSQNDPPSISNISHSPSNPTSSDDVTVTADISDPDGDNITTDYLSYSTDGGNNWTQVNHSSVSGNTYTYIIPAQSDGTNVRYYIYAEDEHGAGTTSSTYSYTVSDNPLQNPIINEIMYHPVPDDISFEYVEIYNPNNVSFDVSNWVFTDGESDFTIPDGIQIPPYGFLVIARDTSQIRSQYGQAGLKFLGDGDDILLGNAGFALSNSGEEVSLLDDNSNTIDQVAYDDGDPWPTEPDGDGPSLGLKNPELDNSVSVNWCSEAGDDPVYGGTPGAANECNNTVENGGFESWNNGIPVSWNLETNVTVAEETGTKHRGNSSVKISVGNDGEGIYENIEQVSSGEKYHFHAWLYALGEVSGHASVGVELRFYNSSWNYIESHGPYYPSGTGTWKRVAVRDTIPNNATKMRIYIIGYSTGKGDAGYADDITFISQGAVATGVNEETGYTGSIVITQSPGKLTFVIPGKCASRLEIFDITGRKIKVLTVRGKKTISTGSFSPGVYFAVLKDRKVKSGKFVIIR